MELLRRLSSKPEPIDEEAIRQSSRQRRKSSFATTAIEDDPVLPSAIKPAIEIFPSSVSPRQETLLISPDSSANGFVITYARTGKHLLTAVTVPSAAPGQSHTRHFYGVMNKSCVNNREDCEGSETDDGTKKLCTLTRDVLSFRKRHHVDDPHNHRRLIEIEFSTSSWNTHELKANISLMNKYSDGQPMEPARLRWRGRRAGLEGVLEWKDTPVAVCARGEETETGEHVLYIAPGMDIYTTAIVVMAVDDRTRRGSDESRSNSYSSHKESNIAKQERRPGASVEDASVPVLQVTSEP